MNTLVLVLVLAMILMSGSALQCNYFAPRMEHRCIVTSETCQGEKNTWGCVICTNDPIKCFRKCMTMMDCSLYNEFPCIKAVCCQWDFFN